jgi:hypothetical protein
MTGVDLTDALELNVVQLRSVKIDTNNGAGIQPLIVLVVALPPGVGDLHGKATERNSPFLINEDNALGLGDSRRRYCDGR